jgi:hypothetical protein
MDTLDINSRLSLFYRCGLKKILNEKGNQYMLNYLKNSLFVLLILMMPYMNVASNSMDIEDYEGSTVRYHKVSLMTDDQKDVVSSVKQSASSQVVSLEDSQTSWASYMTSPIKATMQMTSQFMEIAKSNPKLAIAVGFLYMLPVIEACHCYCYNVKARVCGPGYKDVVDRWECDRWCDYLVQGGLCVYPGDFYSCGR